MFLLPPFYFIQTRLTNWRAVFVHGLLEWIPAFVLTVLVAPIWVMVPNVVVFYLAFISVYELGYLANDQTAFGEEGGRQRFKRLKLVEIVLFVVVRFIVFLVITILMHQSQNMNWWIWFGVLILVFGMHNLIKTKSLKAVTFCYLAFARFFSPVVFILPDRMLQLILLPILLHYIVFRLIIYLDSKEMLQNFDRKSSRFIIGFHMIASLFSIVLSIRFNDLLPVGVSCYYILVSTLSVVSGRVQRQV